MKLIDAIALCNQPGAPTAQEFRCFLGCGFTPLHLATYLRAYLTPALHGRRVTLDTGRYGDLAGSLERLQPANLSAAAVVIEWPDLDPRLGLRHPGGWKQATMADILATAETSAGRLKGAIEAVAASVPVVLGLPTLPLPPAAHTHPAQLSVWEQRLTSLRQSLADWAVMTPGLQLMSSEAIDAASPPATRLDVKSEIARGFPYSVAHAEVVGRTLAQVLAPAPPMKGLITDLDDTLWHGILGEVGVAGVHWDLEHHSLPNGLYQQLLGALADRGVLVAVASKNDASLVAEALRRPDLIVGAEDLFPVLAHWGPKSESVAQILKSWNVGADAVVFIDDSPLELAEVKAAFPAIECIRFPKEDPAAVVALLAGLRSRFGRPRLQEEDRLRAGSLRQAETFVTAAASPASQDSVLADADGVITFTLHRDASDTRAFELLNKTNQFNLNGRRLGEDQWRASLSRPEAFLLTVSYRDKFGPLGKIAVALGQKTADGVGLDHWVMSCRAFSRRIEHHSLRFLFDRLIADRIRFDFTATSRNTPLQECFAGLGLAGPDHELSRQEFESHCPTLYHRVEETPS